MPAFIIKKPRIDKCREDQCRYRFVADVIYGSNDPWVLCHQHAAEIFLHPATQSQVRGFILNPKGRQELVLDVNESDE